MNRGSYGRNGDARCTFRRWVCARPGSALQGADLLVEALREPPVPDGVIGNSQKTADRAEKVDRRWQRLPLFLHVRARRP